MDTAIVWFRQDLRLVDNPALYHAALENTHLIPLYILDDTLPQLLGEAQQWWLHHSLMELQAHFQKHGLCFMLKKGNPSQILLELCKNHKIAKIYWNRCYEPSTIERDIQLKQHLKAEGIQIKSYPGNLLVEPWEISNQQGQYFKVFTAFWKKCLATFRDSPSLPLPAFQKAPLKNALESEPLNSWQLLPTHPNWAEKFKDHWRPGSTTAQEQFKQFIEEKLVSYAIGRNFPAQQHTSRLSPYLHFGEISVRHIWNTLKNRAIDEPKLKPIIEPFLREIGWREFSYHLLYHFPELPDSNFQKKFNRFTWENSKKLLFLWQKGQTGYPLVDAGMRELWHSGYMHNRVRMITASFLTKHLLIDWRYGAQWFWNTLLDADLANNSMNWQWVAGSGVDSAPYYRIFNPILQSEKFDKKGEYIRRWLPELSALSHPEIHQPWKMTKDKLQTAGIILGRDYPAPLIDHEFARKRALARYEALKNKE